ncbi:MAG: phosphoribosylformylglycinamidine synthase subunit PurS [Thermoplasmata archaeon]|nr:phosphoribosylformylglycinamidine synthase subunit PurS [Thermoplasmata archaeon]
MGEPGRKVSVAVRVELKPGVMDAEAESVQKSLVLLGLHGISAVHTARIFTLDFEGVDAPTAEGLAATAVDRLLANPVIHRVTVGPVSG